MTDTLIMPEPLNIASFMNVKSTKGCIDSINNRDTSIDVSTVNIVNVRSFVINGWITDMEKQSGFETVYVEIDDKFFKTEEITERPDVASLMGFENPRLGYSARISTDQLSNQKYNITVYGVSTDGTWHKADAIYTVLIYKDNDDITLPDEAVGYPPGHFYSTIPDLHYIREHENKIFAPASDFELPGINLNTDFQMELLKDFQSYYSEVPFPNKKATGIRYYFENDSFSYSDAIFLYSMIRHLKPKRIIEVGCGFSSAVMLDTRELFFTQDDIELTFIEPYQEERLFSLIKPGETINHIKEPLQFVDREIFEKLKRNDILFIDTSHVVKIGSEVNSIFFDILPLLNSGVFIHIHDIPFPFEYSSEWIYKGWFWNEAYFLRAFLQYNKNFRICFWGNYLTARYPKYFEENMPICRKVAGASIWLEKV
jgi:hypothetical protein